MLLFQHAINLKIIISILPLVLGLGNPVCIYNYRTFQMGLHISYVQKPHLAIGCCIGSSGISLTSQPSLHFDLIELRHED